MSPRHCGLFIFIENDTPQLRAPLTSINVDATTCGPIAQNVIKFRYRNTNDAAIKSKFIFPANSRTCIYHLSANIGGRQIVGKVMEKKEAEKKYEEAVSTGKSAVLVKQAEESSDIIELELGAFGANEEAEVTIKEVFEMKLTRKGTRFQYKFPTSLFVRYGDTITATASQNLPNTEYVLNLKLTSYSGVSSIVPKPWLGVKTSGQLFSFDGNRKVFEKDHDVVLDLILSTDYKGFRLTEAGDSFCTGDTDESLPNDSFISKIKTFFSKGTSGQQQTVSNIEKKLVLSSFLVHVPTTPLSELPAKEYVFVVDCSGSMMGDRIAQARKTLQQLINSLSVGSYFNIVRFGSSFEMLFGEPQEYNSANKQIAVRLAETFGADLGGTQLLDCLKSVVQGERKIVKYKRQVFVLTDGGISNQDETLKLVKQHASKNRFFSFGIGSGCSTALVNGLAEAGMGHASFISDSISGLQDEEGQENLATTCIKSLMASASQHISKIVVTPKPMSPKEPIKMVVDSTCLNVFHDGLFDVTLELTLVNNEEQTKISKQDTSAVETLESPFEPNVLRKLAMTKIIGEMNTVEYNELQYNEINRIIKLSVKEQVLSKHTALVGVADEKTVTGITRRVDNDMYTPQERFRSIPQRFMSAPQSQFICSSMSSPPPPGPFLCTVGIAPPDGYMNERFRAISSRTGGGGGGIPSSRGCSVPSMSMGGMKSMYMAPSPPPISIDEVEDVITDGTLCSDEDVMDEMMDSAMGSLYSDDNEIEEELEDLKSSDTYGMAPSTNDVITRGGSACASQLDEEPECSVYQSITNKQEAGGEWTKKIRSKHDVDLFKKIELSTIEDKTVQFTLYAVLLLLIDFADSFDEWKLSAVKGVTMLKKSIPNLESEISNLLSGCNLEIDDEMLAELFC